MQHTDAQERVSRLGAQGRGSVKVHGWLLLQLAKLTLAPVIFQRRVGRGICEGLTPSAECTGKGEMKNIVQLCVSGGRKLR